jgi:hypothetical protein
MQCRVYGENVLQGAFVIDEAAALDGIFKYTDILKKLSCVA